MWRKVNPPVLLVGMQIGAATVESRMEFPQKKLIMEMSNGLGISLLRMYTKKPETLI